MFLSVCVAISLGRKLIVPWTIINTQSEDQMFKTLSTEMNAGKFDYVQVVDEVCTTPTLMVKCYIWRRETSILQVMA